MEIRSTDIKYTLGENDVIEGCAIVFNSISNVLYDKDKKRFFREVIAPEAITQELIDNSDIKFLINHNKDQMVARRKNGQGSLSVEWREDGVYFSFTKPNTTLGNDLYEMIQRGDLSACSFAFIDGDVDWDFSDRSMPVRTVHSIRALFDLSCVADPAYSETEISARSIEDLEKTIEAEKPETEEVKETPEVKEEPKEQDTNEETTAPEVNETEEENREDDSYLEDLKPYKEILEKL